MTLSKFFDQNDRHGSKESILEICVEYSKRARRVTVVKYIRVYNCAARVWTDMSGIFLLSFPAQADKMIDSVDWAELAAEEVAA